VVSAVMVLSKAVAVAFWLMLNAVAEAVALIAVILAVV